MYRQRARPRKDRQQQLPVGRPGHAHLAVGLQRLPAAAVLAQKRLPALQQQVGVDGGQRRVGGHKLHRQAQVGQPGHLDQMAGIDKMLVPHPAVGAAGGVPFSLGVQQLADQAGGGILQHAALLQPGGALGQTGIDGILVQLHVLGACIKQHPPLVQRLGQRVGLALGGQGAFQRRAGQGAPLQRGSLGPAQQSGQRQAEGQAGGGRRPGGAAQRRTARRGVRSVHGASSSPASGGGRRSSSKRTQVPRPGWLSKARAVPWAAAMAWHSARPTPLPPPARARDLSTI